MKIGDDINETCPKLKDKNHKVNGY